MQGGYPDPNYPQGQGYYGYGQQQVQQGQQQLDYSQGQFPQGAYPPQGQPYTGQPQPQMPAGGGAYSAYPETHQMLPNVQTYQTHVEGLSGWNDPPSRKATPTEDPVLKDTESPVTLIVTTLTQTLDMIKNSPVGVSQARMMQDTEKRLDDLFDKLATDKIERPILAQLIHLSNALKAKDLNTATRISVEFMTTIFAKEGKWVVGLKRLVELYARL